MVAGYLLQHLHEVLHRVRLQFALAQLSLLDEETDVGLLLLFCDTLESVLSHAGLCRRYRLVIQFAGGNHAIANLDGRYMDCLVAHLGIKRQVKVALLHGRLIVESSLHRVVTAQ